MSQAADCIEFLIDAIGPDCTLVIPSFPFAPFGGGELNYSKFVTRDLFFDTDRTPCYISLFGEMFRRRHGVKRSLNPLYPVAAYGPLADELLADTHLDLYPFENRTCYGKLMSYRSFGLGLGLDINTNPFIHLIDRHFLDELPYPMHSEKPLMGEIRRSGVLLDRRPYHFVPPEFRKKIKPRNLTPLLLGKPYLTVTTAPAPAYCLELQPFVEFGMRLAKEAYDAGCVPPWHEGPQLSELVEGTVCLSADDLMSSVLGKLGHSVSLVCYGYNEVESVGEFFDRAVALLNSVTDDYEIVFVDDGSTDGTWDVAQRYAKSNSRIHVVRNDRNRDVGYSFKRGVAMAEKGTLFMADHRLVLRRHRPQDLLRPPRLFRHRDRRSPAANSAPHLHTGRPLDLSRQVAVG